MNTTPRDVRRFWFGDAVADGSWRDRAPLWWGGSEALDREIARRFGAAVAAALAGDLDGWAEAPRDRLALVILMDQFTRNIHRGRPEAYRGDSRAQQLVLDGIARGHDTALHPVEAVFLYMPLVHAEELDLQDRALALLEDLADRAEEVELVRGSVRSARTHREIVARFGRFPHRNAILGRETTAEERDWLDRGGQTFGAR